MTIREELTTLLVKNEQIMENQPSDDLYAEWAELALAVSKTMDGFGAVLRAVQTARDAQKVYFTAKGAGQTYDAIKLLTESKRAEKELDTLIRHWSAQMLPAPDTGQINLF